MSIRSLGEWADSTRLSLPQPGDLIDPSMDEGVRTSVARYLDHGMVLAWLMGPDVCRLCGENLVGDMVSDGVYQWRRSLAHYVREHSIRLPDEFLEHVGRYLGDLAEAPTDDEWWPKAAAKVVDGIIRKETD